MSIPEQQTFRPLRRGYLIAQTLIYLVFTISCVIQAIYRRNVIAENFLTAWWFFALLSAGFAYLTVEACYKLFFTRLVFTRDGFVLYDFLKVTRVEWDQVKKVGEIGKNHGKLVDFGLILKDSAVGKPGLLSMPFVSLVPFMKSWNESPIKNWLVQYKSTLVKK
jgi:hypothetical protein